MTWTLDGRPLRRILVTRLRYLGDVVMSTVVVAMLRRGDPAVEVAFLCEASHAAVLAGHPDLTRVHALGAARKGGDASARAAADATNVGAGRGTIGTAWELRRCGYDLAVDLFFNPRSAWLLWLAGIPRRIGGTTSSSRRRLYTHQALAPSPGERPGLAALAGGGLGEHLARLAPLRLDGRPFLDWFEADAAGSPPTPHILRPEPSPRLVARLQEIGTVADGYVLLAPGATWPSKEWPLEHWRRLAADLNADGRTVVVLQPPGRPDVAAALAPVLPQGHGGVLPVLPLEDALQAVGAATTVVSVDGGIMHASVGMGKPTVALFGPTDPALWFPYESLGPFRVLATRPACHPCHRHACDEFICLPDLGPDRVRAAVNDLPAPRATID